MRKVIGKKGMEMTIAAVITIIIALFVLAALLIAFTNTEGNFRDTIKSFFSDSNVDRIVEQCNNYVDLESQYEYCCVEKEIDLGDGQEFGMKCFDARNESWGSRIDELSCEGVC